MRTNVLDLLGMLAIWGLALLLSFPFGWAVMHLWNMVVPDIFGLPSLSYWQAWALNLLATMLLKQISVTHHQKE